MVAFKYPRCFFALLLMTLVCGCSSYQPTKNVWKTTKGLWNTYISSPASVDYDDRGHLPPEAVALAHDMKGIDTELGRLERAMQNADKPPTQAWLDQLFASFPWLDGFAGVKYDGKILGQQPAESLKNLDFNPLLYEDKKQNSRALRADVQPSPLGPEIMLATPLYDGVDFLGIVVAYFDMRSLMRFSENAEEIVVLCPGALLWPGKYEFAATPLAGVEWEKVVRESGAGTCSNATGSFFYMVRYLGNLPLIFAIPQKGDFPTGNGGIEQGFAFFPQEREKLPPPPFPERKPKEEKAGPEFVGADEVELSAEAQAREAGAAQTQALEEQSAPAPAQKTPSNEIQPGSRDSMLLRKGGGRGGRQIQERQLEGENVEVERVNRPRRVVRQPVIEPPVDLMPVPPAVEPMSRPSPFGPEEEKPEKDSGSFAPPSPFGPAGEDASSQPSQSEAVETPAVPETGAVTETGSASEKPAAATKPEGGEQKQPASESRSARFPDGRPSPFGPPEDASGE